MYKNNSGQYRENIDRSVVEEKPVIPASIRMKPNRPTGRRKVVNAKANNNGTWVAVPK